MPEMNPRLRNGTGVNPEHDETWGDPPDYFIDLPLDVMREVLRYGPEFIEAGAGSGYNAAMLEGMGADLLCYDAYPPDRATNKHFGRIKALKHEVRQHDPKDHSYVNQENRTLLLIWPPLKERMAAEVLNAYKGKWFVYVGEGRNGATAEASFFDTLERDYCEVDRLQIEGSRWEEAHAFIYRRKRREEESEQSTTELFAEVSRLVHESAERDGLEAASNLSSEIGAVATLAAMAHADANPRATMDRICKDIHRTALENMIAPYP